MKTLTIQQKVYGAIAVLSVLVVIAGAVIDHYSTKIAEDLVVLDVLGRQTMLTQAMGKAAKGTSEITGNIDGVAQAAKDTSQGIGQIQSAANELAQMAADLQTLVGQFKY